MSQILLIFYPKKLYFELLTKIIFKVFGAFYFSRNSGKCELACLKILPKLKSLANTRTSTIGYITLQLD